MKPATNEARDGVLNEFTNTVHKHETGAAAFETECGLTRHVEANRLRRLPLDRAITVESASKCGRCFSEAGGY